MQRRIGLDLDGVIVDSIGHWIDVVNRSGLARYQPGELPDTHTEAQMAAWCDRHELEMLILPGPMQGARAALAGLRETGHELVVITARSPRLQGLTEAWLRYHGIMVDRLCFLEGGSKVPAAQAEGVSLMVEDTPRHALALAEGGVPVLLFGAPYNQATAHPLITRCEGWEQVLTRIASQPDSRAAG